jgi:hypothetical protein
MATAPPVPGALLQPQPPVPPQLPVGPRTYLETYSNAANDPWQGAYADLMAQYTTVAAITPEILMTHMLSYGPEMPQAFIMLAAGADPVQLGRIVLMHHPTKHPVRIPATQ